MSKSNNLTDFLTDVANAIRSVKGTSAVINPQDFSTEISAMVKPSSTKSATTYNVSSSDRKIAAKTYLSGAQTIKGVTTSNIIASNIKKGVVVKVGDANSAGRLINITGTYEGSGGSDRVIYSYMPSFTSYSVNEILNVSSISTFTLNTGVTFQENDFIVVEFTPGYYEYSGYTSIANYRFTMGCRVNSSGTISLNTAVKVLGLAGYCSYTGGQVTIDLSLSGSTLTVTPSNVSGVTTAYATASRLNVRSVTVFRL